MCSRAFTEGSSFAPRQYGGIDTELAKEEEELKLEEREEVCSLALSSSAMWLLLQAQRKEAERKFWESKPWGYIKEFVPPKVLSSR